MLARSVNASSRRSTRTTSSGIRELNGDNAVFEAPGDVTVEGRDAATEYAMAWLRAFPDARITVHNELADGDWVVQEFTFTGRTTARSPRQLVRFRRHTRHSTAATSKSSASRERRSRTRLYFDQVQVMTQLGLMPKPATA